MDVEEPIAYFNNCRNRDHVALFGSGAFFDLGTTGRQGTQARNLSPGQRCVVAEWGSDKQIVFDWYSFTYVSLLVDEHGAADRVFFGRLFASEAVPKETAARSGRYAALFKSNGQLKNGSFFHKAIPSKLIPRPNVGVDIVAENDATGIRVGSGFGEPAENKLVESAAVRAVVKDYEADGWSVRSVERDKCGFDLECTKNGAVEQVEVKGVRGTGLCFIITAGVGRAGSGERRNLHPLRRYVGTDRIAQASTTFTGPEFRRQFDLSAIQYRAILAR